MNWFWKRRRAWAGSAKAGLSSGQEAFARRLAVRILKCQQQAADYLNSRTAHFSVGLWKLLLMGFCLVFATYCAALVLGLF